MKDKFKIFFSKINFDESMVKDWIGKNFTTELLFSTSKNGLYIFGGYTKLDWDVFSSYKTDESTYLFSINKKSIIQEEINNALFIVEKILLHLLEVMASQIYIVWIVVKKVVYAAAIFFIPMLVYVIMNLVSTAGASDDTPGGAKGAESSVYSTTKGSFSECWDAVTK